jgi:hypothetical protein
MESETAAPVTDQINKEGYSEDEKAKHESFMREALAMVNQPSLLTTPTAKSRDLISPRNTGRARPRNR